MSASEKLSTDISAKTAEEILQMLQRYGVIFVNRVLFEGRSPEQLQILKGRIQQVIDKHRQ